MAWSARCQLLDAGMSRARDRSQSRAADGCINCTTASMPFGHPALRQRKVGGWPPCWRPARRRAQPPRCGDAAGPRSLAPPRGDGQTSAGTGRASVSAIASATRRDHRRTSHPDNERTSHAARPGDGARASSGRTRRSTKPRFRVSPTPCPSPISSPATRGRGGSGRSNPSSPARSGPAFTRSELEARFLGLRPQSSLPSPIFNAAAVGLRMRLRLA